MPCITLAIELFLILAVSQFQCRQRLRVYSKYSDIATFLDSPHSPILPSPCSCPSQHAPSRTNAFSARIFGLGNSFVSGGSRVREHTQHFVAFPDSAGRTVAGVAGTPSITIRSSLKRDSVCYICASRHHAACRLFLSARRYTPRY